MRLGPMRVGPYGLLQGFADTIKLLTKEDVRPTTADRWVFELAPFVDRRAGVHVARRAAVHGGRASSATSRSASSTSSPSPSLSIVGFVMAGWGSDNKYALLGGVRAAAQLISYEIPLVMAVLAVAMIAEHAEPQRAS